MKKIIFIFIITTFFNCSKCNCSESELISLAESKWIKIYGNHVLKMKPYVIKSKDSIWIIKGTLNPKNVKKTRKGGVPYMIIRKSDCEILRIYHTK